MADIKDLPLNKHGLCVDIKKSIALDVNIQSNFPSDLKGEIRILKMDPFGTFNLNNNTTRIDNIVDNCSNNWIKVHFPVSVGGSSIAGHGWINTNAPFILYITDKTLIGLP